MTHCCQYRFSKAGPNMLQRSSFRCRAVAVDCVTLYSYSSYFVHLSHRMLHRDFKNHTTFKKICKNKSLKLSSGVKAGIKKKTKNWSNSGSTKKQSNLPTVHVPYEINLNPKIFYWKELWVSVWDIYVFHFLFSGALIRTSDPQIKNN